MSENQTHKRSGGRIGRHALRGAPRLSFPTLVREIPTYELLPADAVELIHDESLKILEEVGCEFRDDQAPRQWQAAGADVSGTRVKIDRGLLLELIAKVPSEFTLNARNPHRTVKVGGKNTVFVPMYGAPYVRDLEGKRRYGSLEDLPKFHKLSYLAPQLHSSSSIICEPMEIPVPKRHLHIIQSALTHSDKPFMGIVTSKERAEDVIKMAGIVFGENYVRDNPVVVSITNCNSPLVWDQTMLDAMRVYASHNQPLILAPFALCGASTSASAIGAVAQVNAEALAGVAYTQLVRPGSPFPVETDLDGLLEVGEGIEYELVFTNIGCGDLTNIRIQDASQACLGLDLATIVVTPSTGVTNNSAGGNVDVTIAGPLGPTESVSIVFRGTGLAVGACCNQAGWNTTEIPRGGLSDLDVSDFSPEQPTCHDWLTQNGGGGGDPDATVTKSVRERGCQDPGTTLNYQFDVDVAASGGALSTFTLSDPLAAALTSVVVNPPLSYNAGTNTVSLSGGPIAAGSGQSYTFTARLPCTGSGRVGNTVSLAYDTSAGPVRRSASAGVDYGLPDLVGTDITVVTNLGPDGVFSAGEMADFTVTVKNSGTCDARQVFVEIVLGPEFDTAGATIGQGGFVSPPGTVRWDAVSTPALASVAVGVDAILTVSVPVAASVVTETRVTRTAHAEASGHDLSACGLPDPQADAVSREICMVCAPVGTTQDLLVNREVTNRDTAIINDDLALRVFENPTPNAAACGDTALNVATDVLQTDVGAMLATGVRVPAASVVGPVVFLEVSERCDLLPGADPSICVTKDRATGDLTVRICP